MCEWWIVTVWASAERPFTFRLRVEDHHRGGGGRLEGFAQRKQLFSGGERLR